MCATGVEAEEADADEACESRGSGSLTTRLPCSSGEPCRSSCARESANPSTTAGLLVMDMRAVVAGGRDSTLSALNPLPDEPFDEVQLLADECHPPLAAALCAVARADRSASAGDIGDNVEGAGDSAGGAVGEEDSTLPADTASAPLDDVEEADLPSAVASALVCEAACASRCSRMACCWRTKRWSCAACSRAAADAMTAMVVLLRSRPAAGPGAGCDTSLSRQKLSSECTLPFGALLRRGREVTGAVEEVVEVAVGFSAGDDSGTGAAEGDATGSAAAAGTSLSAGGGSGAAAGESFDTLRPLVGEVGAAAAAATAENCCRRACTSDEAPLPSRGGLARPGDGASEGELILLEGRSQIGRSAREEGRRLAE